MICISCKEDVPETGTLRIKKQIKEQEDDIGTYVLEIKDVCPKCFNLKSLDLVKEIAKMDIISGTNLTGNA